MPTFTAKFIGREKGAIGIFYPIEATVTVAQASETAARLALYDQYEHIQQLTLTPVDLEPRTIYEACKAEGIETDNHESDLYIPATYRTRELLKKYGKRGEAFTSQIDGTRWYDVPFSFDPFWDRVARRAEAKP